MKYSFIKKEIHHDGTVYNQIIAEKNFVTATGFVQKGELGGFIEHGNSDVLSHDGGCWIYPETYVSGNVTVSDNSIVVDSTLVATDGASIKIEGNSNIDNTKLKSNGEIVLKSVHIIGARITSSSLRPVPLTTIAANTVIERDNDFVSFIFDDKIFKGSFTEVPNGLMPVVEVEEVEMMGVFPLVETLFQMNGSFNQDEVNSFARKYVQFFAVDPITETMVYDKITEVHQMLTHNITLV